MTMQITEEVPGITKLDDQAKAVIPQATMQITSQESYDQAMAVAKVYKALRKEIADTFEPSIKAAHLAHKAMLAAMKKHDEPLEKAEKKLNASMVAWVKSEQARVAAENRKREEEARALEQANQVLGLEIEVAQPVQQQVKKSGLVTRDVWKFEITDESLIPRDFMIPNMAKIGERVRALKDEAVIPGIKVYADTVGYAR